MRALSFFVLALFGLDVQARLCHLHPLAAYRTAAVSQPDGIVYAEADSVEGDHQQALLRGNVTFKQDEKWFRAPEMHYAPRTQRGWIPQEALFANPELVLQGEALRFDGQEKSLQFEKGHYFLTRHQAWGSTQEALFQNQQHYLYDVSWTTCQPEKPLWQLQAQELHLDWQRERAYAKHLRFSIRDVPLLYLPYFSYPLGEGRQSGFLIPDLASSDAMGVTLRFPYYWNIAPNQDATFTAQIMSKKGLLLAGEYRYLNHQQSALIHAASTVRRNPDWHLFAEHDYRRGELNSHLLWQQVSSRSYSEDFRPEALRHDTWFLERHAILKWGEHWRLCWQDYQPSRPEAQHHLAQRVPELRYQNQGQWQDWHWRGAAEVTRFRQQKALAGTRYRLHFSLARPWESASYFLRPQIQLDGRAYRLPHSEHHFLLPTVMVDAALNFSRESASGRQFLQPRLYYQYRPYRDQSQIPAFDTVQRTPQWSDFFSAQRFSGGDRLEATHRLTAAVTHRWQGQNGADIAHLGLLWQHEFQPPHKTEPFQLESASTWALNAGAQIHPQWHFDAFTQYSAATKRFSHQRFHLQYQNSPERLFSLAYHQHPQAPKLLSGSLQWRFNEEWRLFQRHDYAPQEKRFLQHIVGIEHQDCCWQWRLAAKRHRDWANRERWRNALYLEFEFKGLGSIGRSSRALLQQD